MVLMQQACLADKSACISQTAQGCTVPVELLGVAFTCNHVTWMKLWSIDAKSSVKSSASSAPPLAVKSTLHTHTHTHTFPS